LIYLILFAEFFRIGLFSIGGGMATLPFLYELAARYDWFDREMLTNMIAISESTPGPLGTNMATFAGYQAAGFFGGVVATVGVTLPSLIIVILVARALSRYKNSPHVMWALGGLRPAALGLVAAAALEVIKVTLFTLDRYGVTGAVADLFDAKSLLLFAILLPAVCKLKWHPAVFIGIAAVVGIVFRF
jgi:chromate transporter